MVQAMNGSEMLSLIACGAARSTLGFPVDHALEYWKTEAQAAPSRYSWDVVSDIVKKKGIWGLSNTAMANFPRRILKEAIRWPFIGYTHSKLIATFPCTFSKEGMSAKIVTGVSVAAFNSLLLPPFEQLMAFRVKERDRYLNFFNKYFMKDGFRSLYRGVSLDLIRQSIVWTTFIGIDAAVNRKWDVIDPHNCHPCLRQLAASFAVATGVVIFAHPFDSAKTHVQMEPELQKYKLRFLPKQLILRHGCEVFYAGVLPAFIQATWYVTWRSMLFKKALKTNEEKEVEA